MDRLREAKDFAVVLPAKECKEEQPPKEAESAYCWDDKGWTNKGYARVIVEKRDKEGQFDEGIEEIFSESFSRGPKCVQKWVEYDIVSDQMSAIGIGEQAADVLKHLPNGFYEIVAEVWCWAESYWTDCGEEHDCGWAFRNPKIISMPEKVAGEFMKQEDVEPCTTEIQ